MKAWFYKWLPIICGCHCRDERSFHFHGKKFPICARCTGELVGIVFSLFSCFFFRLNIIICAVLLIPMIVDGFMQSLTAYESNNLKRFITGILFGYGLCMLFIISLIAAFNYGLDLGRNIRKS